MIIKINRLETIIFILLGLLLFALPILFSSDSYFIAFNSSTGFVGDTIGGITAPFTSLIGSILVYLALKAQIEANKLVQNQFKKQEEDEVYRKQLNLFDNRLNILKEEINNFYYSYFSHNPLDPQKYNYHGSQAIYNLLKQNKSLSHPGKHNKNMYEIEPKLLELRYLLQYIEQLIHSISITKFSSSQHDDTAAKINLYNTISYYFSAKIKNNFKPFEKDFSSTEICKDCKMIHGLPSELLLIVQTIDDKLRMPV